MIFSGTDIVIYRTFEKSYDDNLILDDIDLGSTSEEVIVLVGPSGCGKSNGASMYQRLEPIQGGEIKLNGEKIDPKNKNIAELSEDRNGIPEL